MATKTKGTDESSSKAAKSDAPAPTVKKNSGVKVQKSIDVIQEPAPGKTVKLAKTAEKTVLHTVGAGSESESEITPVDDKNETVKTVASVKSTGERVATQEQKWQDIRVILDKLKDEAFREIRKSVKNGTEAVAAIEPGGDIYDQASSERDRELGLLLGDREREKIHSIDEALLRIDDGEYGICEECDEDIPLGRLRAMPFTRHCVKCKSDLEKFQAQTKRVEEERAYREIPIGSEEDES